MNVCIQSSACILLEKILHETHSFSRTLIEQIQDVIVDKLLLAICHKQIDIQPSLLRALESVAKLYDRRAAFTDGNGTAPFERRESFGQTGLGSIIHTGSIVLGLTSPVSATEVKSNPFGTHVFSFSSY
jgi:hypothetical protein